MQEAALTKNEKKDFLDGNEQARAKTEAFML